MAQWIYKLNPLLGYFKAMTKLMDSYLKRTKLRVKVEHKISTEKEIEAGVPQLSVLAPRLFSIFTSDIPKTDRTKLGRQQKYITLDGEAIQWTDKSKYLPRSYDAQKLNI